MTAAGGDDRDGLLDQVPDRFRPAVHHTPADPASNDGTAADAIATARTALPLNAEIAVNRVEWQHLVPLNAILAVFVIERQQSAHEAWTPIGTRLPTALENGHFDIVTIRIGKQETDGHCRSTRKPSKNALSGSSLCHSTQITRIIALSDTH